MEPGRRTAHGVWLLFAPAAFGVDIRQGAADVSHIGGRFVIVTAVIAMAAPVRARRRLNVTAGPGSPFRSSWPAPALGYAGAIVVTGLAVAVLWRLAAPHPLRPGGALAGGAALARSTSGCVVTSPR